MMIYFIFVLFSLVRQILNEKYNLINRESSKALKFNLKNELNEYHEYNITSGDNIFLYDLNISDIYKFYLPVRLDYIIIVRFTVYDISHYGSSQLITLYEYSTLNSDDYLEKANLNLNQSLPDNPDRYEGKYIIKNSASNYVSVEFKPNYKIPKVYIKIYIETTHEYDLTNDKDFYLENIYKYHRYRFFIKNEIEEKHSIDIQIKTTDTQEISSEILLTSYKYNKRNLPSISSASYYSCIFYTENICTTNYFDSGNYISFEFEPKNDMLPIYFKATLYIENYLLPNKPQYLAVLYNYEKYKIHMDVDYNYITNIEFNKTDNETISQNMLVFEYPGKYFDNYFTKNVSTSAIHILFKNIFRINYEIYNNNTRTIILEFKPSYNILFSYGTLSFKKKFFQKNNIINNEWISLNTLYNKLIYRFYLPAKLGQFITIELKKNNQEYFKFSFLNISIYEYSDKYLNTFLWDSEIFFEYDSSENKYKASYSIYYPYTNLLAFDIESEESVSDIYIKAGTSLVEIKEYNLNNNTSLYLGNLQTIYKYKFNIPVCEDCILNIELINNNLNFVSYQYITLYEYAKTESIKDLLFNTSICFNLSSYNKTYSANYRIHNSSTNYLSFEMLPIFEMSSVHIKSVITRNIEYVNYDYYYIGYKLHIGKLNPWKIYTFKVYVQSSSSEEKITNIELYYKSENYKSFQNIKIYEYYDYYSKPLYYSNLDLSFSSLKKIYSGNYYCHFDYTLLLIIELNPEVVMPSAYIRVTVRKQSNFVEKDITYNKPIEIGEISFLGFYKFL